MKIITHAFRQDALKPRTFAEFLSDNRAFMVIGLVCLADFALGRLLFGVFSELRPEDGDNFRYWMKCLGHAVEYMPIFAAVFFISYSGFNRRHVIGALLSVPLVFTASVCGEIYRQTPAVYGALLYFGAWIVLAWWIGMDRSVLDVLGLTGERARVGVAYGIATGLIMGGHLFFVLNVTKGYTLKLLPFSLWVESLSFELGINAVGEELFYRAFIFRALVRRGFGFWPSTLVTTVLYVFRYFADPRFGATPEIAIGATFYFVLISVLSCAIFRRSRSLLAPALMNVTLSMVFYSCPGLNY